MKLKALWVGRPGYWILNCPKHMHVMIIMKGEALPHDIAAKHLAEYHGR
jgi:hypothetical protein